MLMEVVSFTKLKVIYDDVMSLSLVVKLILSKLNTVYLCKGLSS